MTIMRFALRLAVLATLCLAISFMTPAVAASDSVENLDSNCVDLAPPLTIHGRKFFDPSGNYVPIKGKEKGGR